MLLRSLTFMLSSTVISLSSCITPENPFLGKWKSLQDSKETIIIYEIIPPSPHFPLNMTNDFNLEYHTDRDTVVPMRYSASEQSMTTTQGGDKKWRLKLVDGKIQLAFSVCDIIGDSIYFERAD